MPLPRPVPRVFLWAFPVLASGFLLASCAPYGPSWGDLADGAAALPFPTRPRFIDLQVRLADEEFRPKPADSPVELINGDSLSREALQHLLDDHVVIARFEVSGTAGQRLERASAHVRRLGGDVVLTTHYSALIGVIYRDVRYAGPLDGDEAMYALRRRVHEPESTFRDASVSR